MTTMMNSATLPPEACREPHEHGKGSCQKCRWCGLPISQTWPIYTHEQNCEKRPK